MKYIVAFLCSMILLVSYGQKKIAITYTDEKVLELAREVYGSYDEYMTSELLEDYRRFLERVEIVMLSPTEMEQGTYPLSSTLPLKNKYNIAVDYDKEPHYDIQKFNPLKYFWVIGEDGSSKYYRIYKENYLIRIASAK